VQAYIALVNKCWDRANPVCSGI